MFKSTQSHIISQVVPLISCAVFGVVLILAGYSLALPFD